MKREGLEGDRNGGRAKKTEGEMKKREKTDKSEEEKKRCSIGGGGED